MRINPVAAQTTFSGYTFQAAKTSPLPGKKDVVTLSEEGRNMQAGSSNNPSSLIGSLDNFMDGAGKDGVITLSEIRAFGEQNFNNAKGILAETLVQLGISSDHNITVRTDKEGMVRADSDLSIQDNERLEIALSEHPQFQQALTKAGSSQTLLDAAEKHVDFAKAYAQNPEAAVARYGIGNSLSGAYVFLYTRGQASLYFKNHPS